MKKGGSPVRIMNRAEVQAMWKARKVSLNKTSCWTSTLIITKS